MRPAPQPVTGLTRTATAAIGILLLGACTSLEPRNPVPAEYAEKAFIPGIPLARWWGDELPVDDDVVAQVWKQALTNRHGDFSNAPLTLLGLSGGGANGAYGAGLLVGWTEAGDRPEFDIVTGVSTGALIAPFAFLGPDYDDSLREVFTKSETEDILIGRSLLSGLSGEAMASTAPLKALIERHVDDQMIAAIAREGGRGRSLWIATTNLDSGRSVIWSLTRIARSGNPGALELTRDILRASAAIPVAFDPVYIEVEANGATYDEMHVDGNASRQIFLYPPSLDFRELGERIGWEGERSLYLIRNGRLETDWKATERSVLAIAGRSIETLIQAEGEGSLYRIYAAAGRDGIEYNLAYIPRDFTPRPEEPFDSAYMRVLFGLGYDLARDGYPWARQPPGLQ